MNIIFAGMPPLPKVPSCIPRRELFFAPLSFGGTKESGGSPWLWVLFMIKYYRNKHMKLKLNICALAAFLSVPLAALAVPPTYVTGLSAQYENGNVILGWNAPAETDIAYYLIYYSFESILGNDGLFDETVQTTGPVNTFTFPAPAGYTALFMAVAAVNSMGEEGGLLVEEVSVQIPGAQIPEDTGSSVPTPNEDLPFLPETEPPAYETRTPSEEPASGPQPTALPEAPVIETPQAVSLGLVKAQAVSPTELQAEFTSDISVDSSKAPQAFKITDAGGAPLPILNMYIEGAYAKVTTQTQTRGKVYAFSFSEPAFSPKGLPIDANAVSIFFTGHEEGADPSLEEKPIAAPQTDSSSSLKGVKNFKLNAPKQTNGLYNLQITWNVDGDRSEIAKYAFYQSRDGGATFSDPQLADGAISKAEIPDNQPGELIVAMAIVKADGTSFMAAQDKINIAGSSVQSQGQPSSSLGQSVPPNLPALPANIAGQSARRTAYQPSTQIEKSPASGSSRLNKSGFGLEAALLSAIFGGAAGWHANRRRRVAD